MAPSTELVTASNEATQSIDPDQTLKACKALLAHIKKTAQESEPAAKKPLLDDSDDENTGPSSPIWLTLTTKRHIAKSRSLQPAKIPLPHPLQSVDSDSSLSICLITADPQRTFKDVVASPTFPAHLRARIGRVIGYSKLRAKFRDYEAQRRLLAEYDVFLADDRIVNRLPQALGKSFYRSTAKRPISIVISPKAARRGGKGAKPSPKAPKGEPGAKAGAPADVAAEIEKALGCALVHLSPSTNTAVRVGLSSFAPQQLAENVEAVVGRLVQKHVPKGWSNVRSVYVKGPTTTALPIWLTDELWLEEGDVLREAAAAPAKESGKKEKANVSKKRKSLDTVATGDGGEKVPAKRARKAAPESNDDKLDEQIKERKARLKKQKAKATAAMED